jgi:hypothetical protein
VVFLTLVICLGIYDIEDVQRWLLTFTPINEIFSNVIEKVEKIAKYEQIESVLNTVREVFFNTHAGDQTPFKTFREAEYLTTREWMSYGGENTAKGEPRSRITLTREVLDLVVFLKKQGSQVLALSDRPIEATEPDPQVFPDAISLLEIPMTPLGNSIEHYLKKLL